MKILISACLLGENTRYNGIVKPVTDPRIIRWFSEGLLVSFCPEISGGLNVPRPPAEIINGSGGSVWEGKASVFNSQRKDVTRSFVLGAFMTLETCRKHNIKLAVLKDGSPSCGSSYIYDGSFSGKKISGMGITTSLLIRNGIMIVNENELEMIGSDFLPI